MKSQQGGIQLEIKADIKVFDIVKLPFLANPSLCDFISEGYTQEAQSKLSLLSFRRMGGRSWKS